MNDRGKCGWKCIWIEVEGLDLFIIKFWIGWLVVFKLEVVEVVSDLEMGVGVEFFKVWFVFLNVIYFGCGGVWNNLIEIRFIYDNVKGIMVSEKEDSLKFSINKL